MRTPKHIVVGSRKYDIVHDRAKMSEQCRDEQSDLYGLTSHREMKVYIEPKQADLQKADTLLHELLHVVFDFVGLAQEWGGATEESVVARTTPALLDAIRKNPKLIEALNVEG